MHPKFSASKVKFILKCEIAFPDGLSFLSVAQKLSDWMSWNFASVYLILLAIVLRQNTYRLRFKKFEIKGLLISFIWLFFI